jgi:serine/threonine protein kinase
MFLQHNVVIDDQGNPRVCDFGRSKVLEQTGYTTKLLATAIYMAPELIDDECTDQDDDSQELFAACLTKASDVYAFGMVALEVCSEFVCPINHEESRWRRCVAIRPSLSLISCFLAGR